MTTIIDLDGCKVSATVLEKCLNAMVHNQPLLFIGPPGSGKTMFARRLAMLRNGAFRAPHHTVSAIGMTGNAKRPEGECVRAHRGTLFLDEMPEFGRVVLEVIEHAHRDKEIRHYIRDSESILITPTDFYLIAAMNDCPCGYLNAIGVGGETLSRQCTCSPHAIARYHERTAGFRKDVGFVEVALTRPVLRNTQPCIMAPGESVEAP